MAVASAVRRCNPGADLWPAPGHQSLSLKAERTARFHCLGLGLDNVISQ